MNLKRTLMWSGAAGVIAAVSVYGLCTNRPVQSLSHGALTSGNSAQRTSYYIDTSRGFDNAQSVHFSVPFTIERVEWRTDTQQSVLTIRLSQTPSPDTLAQAGFCVEIAVNEKRWLVWWGHNLRLKIAPNLPADQAVIVDLARNAIVGYGNVRVQGATVEITCPMPFQSVETAYLRYIPSEEAFKQAAGSVGIVEILRAQSAPEWGGRVRTVQGGYLWHAE